MIYLLAFVVLVLAAARATRVIVIDEIALPLRTWILRKYPPPSKPGKLVTCYWCAGFWMSGLWVASSYVITAAWGVLPWSSWPAIPVLTFAVSYLAALTLDIEEKVNGV